MKRKFTTSGFTLIEIIVAIGIFSLIVGLIATFGKNIFTYKTVVNDTLLVTEDARTILKTLVTELRSASPSNNGAYPIIQAGTSSLSFYSDVDGDGVKDQIRYFASSSSLYRGIIVPTGSPLVYNSNDEKISLLAQNLRNGSGTTTLNVFDYYDNAYNGVTSSTTLAQPVVTTTIRLIKITLMLDVNQNNLPIPRVYTTEVTLRNLKDNL